MSPETIETGFEVYTQIVSDILTTARKIDDFHVSESAFSAAMMEANKDFFAFARRRLPNGVSKGKIVGVFVFRLARAQILSLPKSLIEDRVLNRLNYLAALSFGLKTLKINLASIPDDIHTEIQYTLVHRHVNQETLGLCFDVLRALIP